MWFNYLKSCSYWLVLPAFLILMVAGSILFGGVDAYVKHRKVLGTEVPIEIKSIHFFTKEFVARQYQKFIAEPLPANTTLPSFHLFVAEEDLESLEENLPASAKLQYKQSHLKMDKPEFMGAAQFRYRGGLPLHWFYEKKSIRVKLPPYSTYRNERRFNLVNPTSRFTILDWVSYNMARSIGLLTPDYFPARLFINNKYNGLHFFLSAVDESLLRKNTRMPGSIYEGDTRSIADPFGPSSGLGEAAFYFKDSVMLWFDERLWKKTASRNAESLNDREDIKKLFNIMHETEPLEFMQAFDTYFDKEKFYLFWGLDNLVGSYHHDLFHNHKIYFDPYRGKFEPIEWDMRFWSANQIIPVTPLYKRILLNPILKYENDLITYKLWKRFTVDHVIAMINDASDRVKDELAADPYRQHPDVYNKYFGIDKVVPLSMNEYSDAIEQMKTMYKVRHKNIKGLLDSSNASYDIEVISENQLQITIAVTASSPVDFDPWSIIPATLHGDVKLSRIYEDKIYPVLNNGQLDRLYGGIAVNQHRDAERQNKSPLDFTNDEDKYSPSPLHYRYLVKGLSTTDLIEVNELSGINSITSDLVKITQDDNFSKNENTVSLHPWKLLSQTKTFKNEIILSGEIEAYYDLVFTEEQKVTILPGTKFKLYDNTSVFFYGQVFAKGTVALPIKFERMTTNNPWGSIVIQGEKASGSHMSHILVSGGSVTSRNLIHYPGQLNIHDVNSFKLEDCTISDNSIGDDALHVAYSQGEIKRCEFKNTAFDALDMDIVDVKVIDSVFFNTGNDAIDLMNSKTMIDDVRITGSGDKCISVGEASHVTIRNSQLTDCQLGIAVKDHSIALVENIQFSIASGNAIALYRKNPRYSKGGEISGDRLYGMTEEDIMVGDYSVNKIQEEAYMPAGNFRRE